MRGGTEGDSPSNETFKASPGKTGQQFLKNPHTAMALLICIIGFIFMWAIFFAAPPEDGYIGKKSFMIYEISMSVMAMVGAASGLAYYILQEDTDAEMLVNGFPVLALLSFASWLYFTYEAYSIKESNKTRVIYFFLAIYRFPRYPVALSEIDLN